MRNRFDLQLKQLNDDIIEMGNMIERAIEMGVYALIGHDTDKAKQTIDYDMDIDHMERDIEALCMKLLLQQQPGGKRSETDFLSIEDDHRYGANRRSGIGYCGALTSAGRCIGYRRTLLDPENGQ